jgi:hypothetical protein
MRKVFVEAPTVENEFDAVGLLASALAWGARPLGCSKGEKARRKILEQTEDKVGGINLRRAILGSYWLGMNQIHGIRLLQLSMAHGDEEVRTPYRSVN